MTTPQGTFTMEEYVMEVIRELGRFYRFNPEEAFHHLGSKGMMPQQLQRHSLPKQSSGPSTKKKSTKDTKSSTSETKSSQKKSTLAEAQARSSAKSSTDTTASKPKTTASTKAEKQKTRKPVTKEDMEMQQRKLSEKARGLHAVHAPGPDGKPVEIYRWGQDLTNVNIQIPCPPNTRAQHLEVKITSSSLLVKLRGSNQAYLSEKFPAKINSEESVWTLSDGLLEIELRKIQQGQTWPSALLGHPGLDEYTVNEMKKKQMLERFNHQYPGFDFSGAKFDGSAPDPNKFLGGFEKKLT
eukprot:g2469.t1